MTGRKRGISKPRPGRGAVTMTEVGRMAGVSQVTVSRALSSPAKVSPETLARVHAAIRQSGFVPNALAGALASNRSKLVTALVPSITNIVYAALLRTFSAEMRRQGYQILLSETGHEPADEEALIAAHLSRRPDAVLLTGTDHSPEARRMLQAADVPVVEVWDITETPVDICVGFSHVAAGAAVAAFARAAGHDRAVTVTANDARAHRRKTAFAEAFVNAGGAAPAMIDCPGPASLAAGRAALAAALDTRGVTGGLVFCSSDLLAHGVLIEARTRGLSVPRDLAVIGFGDQDFAAAVDPALTTVRVDRDRLGQAAAGAILERIAGQSPARRVIDLGFEILRRASA